jgi:Rieske Fe-S protein
MLVTQEAGERLTQPTRRVVLASAAGVSAAAVLAACGDDSGGGGTTPGGGGGGAIRTGDIPVGGGKVFGDQGVVITQPSAGVFKGFSATCTHQGCQVGEVAGGTINCPCHFSMYSIEDGSVKGGPAPRALETRPLKVEGDSITLA